MQAAAEIIQDVRLETGQEVLGKYVVERILGEGGMGRVYAIKHRDLGRSFALKVLLSGYASDLSARRKFAREARAAANLTSPHVARVFDSGELPGGTPYMVLELLEGCDLAHEVPKGIAADSIVVIALQILDALAEAHALSIVHRDLKPENVFLLGGQADDPLAKVLDFGIAKQLGHTTTAEGLVGTPQYIAPEQLQDRPIDCRVDLWALGVLIYESLTHGIAPFDGSSVSEVFGAILLRAPQPLPASVNPKLVAIVAHALEKDPVQRYQTADEFAKALLPLVPESLFHAVPKRWRSATRELSPPSSADLPVVAPLREAEEPIPSPPAGGRAWIVGVAAAALALAGGLFFWSRASSGDARTGLAAGQPPASVTATSAKPSAPSSQTPPAASTPDVPASAPPDASGEAPLPPGKSARPKSGGAPRASGAPDDRVHRGKPGRAPGPDDPNFGY